MKKALIALATVTAAATALCSLAACTEPGQKVKVIEIELTTEDYAYAINKENTELLTAVNGYLTEWKADGTLTDILNSYFDGSATFSYNNPSSSQAGDFIVATESGFPPFESVNSDGYFYGADIEIAYKIAEKLGKRLYIKDMDFDSIVTDVEAGNSDIGMAGLSVTGDRLLQVNFTETYYTSAQVITVLESDTTFDGCTTADEILAILSEKSSSYKIGTQGGTTGFFFSSDELPNVTTKDYSTGSLAMQDLSNGKIDAVILDIEPSKMIAKKINK